MPVFCRHHLHQVHRPGLVGALGAAALPARQLQQGQHRRVGRHVVGGDAAARSGWASWFQTSCTWRKAQCRQLSAGDERERGDVMPASSECTNDSAPRNRTLQLELASG
jgi:hypothetical protein